MAKIRRATILELSDDHLFLAGVDPRKVDDEEFFDMVSQLAMLHIGPFTEDSKILKWLIDYAKRNPDKTFVNNKTDKGIEQ